MIASFALAASYLFLPLFGALIAVCLLLEAKGMRDFSSLGYDAEQSSTGTGELICLAVEALCVVLRHLKLETWELET
jgi:hypothetical protein